MTNFEDFQTIAKENFDKQVASLAVLQKGAQTVASEIVDYSKMVFETGSSAIEKLAGVKSLERAVEIQTEFAKATYEGLVHHLTKVNSITTEAAKDAYKPIEASFAKAK